MVDSPLFRVSIPQGYHMDIVVYQKRNLLQRGTNGKLCSVEMMNLHLGWVSTTLCLRLLRKGQWIL